MVGDLSLLAVTSVSPVVLPPSKELHGVLPLQGKWPQDASVQLSTPLQHPPHHLEGMHHQVQPVQMVVPGAHQGQALLAAYQALVMPDTATLIDVQAVAAKFYKTLCALRLEAKKAPKRCQSKFEI